MRSRGGSRSARVPSVVLHRWVEGAAVCLEDFLDALSRTALSVLCTAAMAPVWASATLGDVREGPHDLRCEGAITAQQRTQAPGQGANPVTHGAAEGAWRRCTLRVQPPRLRPMSTVSRSKCACCSPESALARHLGDALDDPVRDVLHAQRERGGGWRNSATGGSAPGAPGVGHRAPLINRGPPAFLRY